MERRESPLFTRRASLRLAITSLHSSGFSTEAHMHHVRDHPIQPLHGNHPLIFNNVEELHYIPSVPSTSIQQKQGVRSVKNHPATPYHKVHHSYNKTKTRVTVLCFVASFTTFSSVGKPFLLRMSSTNFPWKFVANLPVAEVSSVIKNQNVCHQTVVVLCQ